ncbi:MAG: glycosyltransferase family 9 protein, partial [Verrucomicrobia bacterium]|nr:glycosyltransferase family 9 protein [Verrucomicrobiota bacterium]
MKTAVIRFSALGDIAYTLPFLRALKVRPLIITTAMGRELLKDEFDEFLILKGKRLPDVLALIAEIRSRRFDLLIDLQNNDRSWAIDSLSGVKKKFTNKGMPHGVPALDNMMRILEPTGILGEPDTAFEPKPRKYIVLNVGSSEKWKSKRLPDYKWQEFAALLLKRYNLPFVLTGSPDEADYVTALAAKLPGEIRNRTGKTSLQELKKLLGDAFLAVSTDSAAMHISAAMKTPTIGLFGATNWIRSAPLGPWTTVLYDRTVYPDDQPPEPNRTELGSYYDQINIAEGLDRL